ncbi:MAG: hypothetical protein MJ005_05625 [Methanocorpusculum sp.]|nr:hypothetical protein [Candidatus Methanocorpusculum equi]MCQ2358218.1 hypothetical protein [Methanocorpusculum sp.]
MGFVIKIGGSLADTAGDVLSAVETAGIPALIVPGGGAFADSVRAESLDDDTAHWKAVSAMNRYGVFLSSFGFARTETLSVPEAGISILLPERLMKCEDPLPHSWDVTSDSIALWVADTVHEPLILVKSRAGDLTDTGYVDSYFLAFQKRCSVQVSAVNGRNREELSVFFNRLRTSSCRR